MRLSGGELTHLWPNFCVLELAPTTAKNWDEKKVLMDASVVMVGEMSEQWILVNRWACRIGWRQRREAILDAEVLDNGVVMLVLHTRPVNECWINSQRRYAGCG